MPVREICRLARQRHPGIVDGRTRSRILRSVARPGVRVLRHEPAQVAAGAGRHGVSVREKGAHPGAVAADGGAGSRAGGTSASSRRSGPTRRRTTTPISEALEFYHAIGDERKGRGCGTCATAGRSRCSERPGAKVLTSFDPAQGCAIGLLSLAGLDPEKVTAHLCGTASASSSHRSNTRSFRASASHRTCTARSARLTPSSARSTTSSRTGFPGRVWGPGLRARGSRCRVALTHDGRGHKGRESKGPLLVPLPPVCRKPCPTTPGPCARARRDLHRA